jgi:hypothetical protein
MTLWSVRTLIISAERWVDVRDWARLRFDKDPEIVALQRPYSADMYPDVELVWVGSDAGARPNKRLEVRERTIQSLDGSEVAVHQILEPKRKYP